MTTILHHIELNRASAAIGLFGLSLSIAVGCASAEQETTERASYEPIAMADASFAVASEIVPTEDQLCSLGIGQTHYVFARALLGTPAVSVAGSYLEYTYGSQRSVADGLQVIDLTFGPDEIFEGALTTNVAKPACWAEAEIESEYRRKELPPLMQASTLFQSPDDYEPVPSEDQLCQIAIGRTLAMDVWFDILTTGFMRRLRMGPRDSVINFRYGDRDSDRVVSLYFYFSAADPAEDHDLFFPLQKVVAYNLAALPACWQ